MACTLGAPYESAARKVALSTSYCHAVFQRTLHVADDQRSMAVALDHKGFLSPWPLPAFAITANVVACQIDQHDMLNALAGSFTSSLLNGACRCSGVAPRGRCRQRADGDGFSPTGFARAAHQNFGQEPHHPGNHQNGSSTYTDWKVEQRNARYRLNGSPQTLSMQAPVPTCTCSKSPAAISAPVPRPANNRPWQNCAAPSF